MTNQLHFIDTPNQPRPAKWRLDEQTKTVGRVGLAQAREALQVAQERAARRRNQERHQHVAATVTAGVVTADDDTQDSTTLPFAA